MFPLRGVRPALFTPMELLCRQTRIPCFGRWQNVADTVANNVREQMEPLLVLLKQAQDHSEVLEQRCHGLGARQSVIQERANQISCRHVGCRVDFPAEGSRLANETLKTNGATSQPSTHVDVQPAAVPRESIDPSELKQLTRASSNGAWQIVLPCFSFDLCG